MVRELEQCRGIVGAVVAQVLETMFFSEAVPAQCEHASLAGAESARIRFDGSHCGEMLLSVSEEAVGSLAAAFLGLDPEEATEPLRGEVILELANILCGAVLSQLWPDSRLALAAPEPAGCVRHEPGGLHGCFALPEGLLAVSIRLCEFQPRG